MRPAPKFEGTLSFDQYPTIQPNQSAGAVESTPASPSGPAVPRPTAAPDRAFGPSDAQTVESSGSTKREAGGAAPSEPKPAAPLAGPRVKANKKVALPASLDTSDQLPRLRHVCKLLKGLRHPTCGINGAVTLIPFELSRVGPLQLSAIAQSARADVSMIQDTLGVRSPVTAVLVGLEQDKGFSELVRRLQPGLLSRRLGGRFDLRSRPTPEELNSHSDRLCDAFEDWVYRLFSREDGLAQQRGNRKLYALTSKIRHELKPRLRIVLGQAFGCESSEQDVPPESDDSFFFSGCYFAASGASTGQPAFVKGVLKDKLVDEQSKVEWTKDVLRTHHRVQIFAVLGWIVSVIIAVLILVKLFLLN